MDASLGQKLKVVQMNLMWVFIGIPPLQYVVEVQPIMCDQNSLFITFRDLLVILHSGKNFE